MERFAGRFVSFEGREPPALEHLAKIVEGGDEIAHRLGDVRR